MIFELSYNQAASGLVRQTKIYLYSIYKRIILPFVNVYLMNTVQSIIALLNGTIFVDKQIFLLCFFFPFKNLVENTVYLLKELDAVRISFNDSTIVLHTLSRLNCYMCEAPIAQRLEHWSCKPGVGSSNLPGGWDLT